MHIAGAPRRDRLNHLLGYILLGGWMLAMGWAFWLIEGRPAHARAQLASAPQRVESIESWGASRGAGRNQRPLLILLPSSCVCAGHAVLRERLQALAHSTGLASQIAATSEAPHDLLPPGTGAALFNTQGRLLFAGPLESPLHCSDGRSLVELVLPHAADDRPPLWAPVIDEPCACDGRYLPT